MSDKICPVCNEKLKLEESNYPMGSAFLKTDRVHADIYSCPKCGRIELFSAKSDMVTCPKCGNVHSAKEACPICALNEAFDVANK